MLAGLSSGTLNSASIWRTLPISPLARLSQASPTVCLVGDSAINSVPRIRAWMFSSVVSSAKPAKSLASVALKASNSGTMDNSS